MNELKFKNALFAVLYLWVFSSVCILISWAVCFIVTYVWEGGKDMKSVSIIFGSIFLIDCLLSVIVVIFNPTIVVTETEIKKCRGKKVKWSISKEEIKECIYNRMLWFMFLDPISTINAFYLQFRIKDKTISKKFCNLSLKQVLKIQQTFNYPIRIIDTIYEK